MPKIVVNVDNKNATHDMIFHFPDHWQAIQYDAENGFYRKRYKQFADSKCVDIAAIGPDRTKKALWLIEVKDYRNHSRTKEESPFVEFQKKVRDSLACMFVGAIRDKDSFEFQATRCEKIRLVLHYENGIPSRMNPIKVHSYNKTLKLRQDFRKPLKAIDTRNQGVRFARPFDFVTISFFRAS